MFTHALPSTKNIVNTVLERLPRSARGHVVAVLGEFTGTIFFLFFAFAGTQVANISSNYNIGTTVITATPQKTPQQLLYISLSFGFSLAVNAWVFFRISGGLFNPAVTVGMFLIGGITLARTVLLCITQILGGIVAAAFVRALFTGELNVSTTLNETTSLAQGTIIEMILTAQLVFTIFMLAAEKHAGNFIAPVGIGLSLFIAELTGVFWTGGSLNPARSFGPAVTIHSFPTYHWIYWVGPLAGSLLAVLLFRLIKALEYESANPDPEKPIGNPTSHVPHDNEQPMVTRVGRCSTWKFDDLEAQIHETPVIQNQNQSVRVERSAQVYEIYEKPVLQNEGKGVGEGQSARIHEKPIIQNQDKGLIGERNAQVYEIYEKPIIQNEAKGTSGGQSAQIRENPVVENDTHGVVKDSAARRQGRPLVQNEGNSTGGGESAQIHENPVIQNEDRGVAKDTTTRRNEKPIIQNQGRPQGMEAQIHEHPIIQIDGQRHKAAQVVERPIIQNETRATGAQIVERPIIQNDNAREAVDAQIVELPLINNNGDTPNQTTNANDFDEVDLNQPPRSPTRTWRDEVGDTLDAANSEFCVCCRRREELQVDGGASRRVSGFEGMDLFGKGGGMTCRM